MPRLVLCSTAARATETAELVLPGLGSEVTLEVERDIYDADADDLVERMRQVTEEVDSLMVVGHNPSLFELVHLLVSDDDTEATRRLESFPTCALAEIETTARSWGELEEGTGHLGMLFHP